jgi:hypothetical protein
MRLLDRAGSTLAFNLVVNSKHTMYSHMFSSPNQANCSGNI